jgi:hypothetical protein
LQATKKQQLVSEEYNNETRECEGKVGHPIAEEKGVLLPHHHLFGRGCSRPIVSLTHVLLLLVDAIFSPSLGCVWYFFHCLEGLELDKLVMNE